MLDELAIFVQLPFFRSVAEGIDIGHDPDDLVGSQETILDALFERVGVDRLPEILVVVFRVFDDADLPSGLVFLGDGFLLWGGGQTEVGGGLVVVEHFAPGGIRMGAAPVALVDDHEVEEVGRELPVDLFPFLFPRDRLVKAEVDLVVPLDLAVGDLVHHLAKRCEILLDRLIDEDVAVREEEDALLGLGFPEPPDDLEGGVGFAGAGSHGQQDSLLAIGDGSECAINGNALVVVGRFVGAIGVTGLGDHLPLWLRRDVFPPLVEVPEFLMGWKFVEGDFPDGGLGEPGAVVKEKALPVRADGDGGVQHFGIKQGLLHAMAEVEDGAFGLDDGQDNFRRTIE